MTAKGQTEKLRCTGAGEPSGADAPTMLAQATEAVLKATEAVRTTSRSIAEAVEAGNAAHRSRTC
jgi:hypothetical protein